MIERFNQIRKNFSVYFEIGNQNVQRVLSVNNQILVSNCQWLSLGKADNYSNYRTKGKDYWRD